MIKQLFQKGIIICLLALSFTTQEAFWKSDETYHQCFLGKYDHISDPQYFWSWGIWFIGEKTSFPLQGFFKWPDYFVVKNWVELWKYWKLEWLKFSPDGSSWAALWMIEARNVWSLIKDGIVIENYYEWSGIFWNKNPRFIYSPDSKRFAYIKSVRSWNNDGEIVVLDGKELVTPSVKTWKTINFDKYIGCRYMNGCSPNNTMLREYSSTGVYSSISGMFFSDDSKTLFFAWATKLIDFRDESNNEKYLLEYPLTESGKSTTWWIFDKEYYQKNTTVIDEATYIKWKPEYLSKENGESPWGGKWIAKYIIQDAFPWKIDENTYVLQNSIFGPSIIEKRINPIACTDERIVTYKDYLTGLWRTLLVSPLWLIPILIVLWVIILFLVLFLKNPNIFIEKMRNLAKEVMILIFFGLFFGLWILAIGLVFWEYTLEVIVAIVSMLLVIWIGYYNNSGSNITQNIVSPENNKELDEQKKWEIEIQRQKNEQELIIRRLALVPRNHLDTFLQHAERRFRKKDKYGNSDHTALEKEVLEYLRMIAKTQQRYKDQITAIDALARGKSYPYLNADFKWLYQYLKWKFEEYIENKKNNIGGEIKNIAEMSGIEFEEYLAEIFKSKGYNVQMTPISSDQWADLIVEKNMQKIAIQAKRYQWNVWNAAVQEVIAAKWYYECSAAWVITNSYYTSSAQDLAEKNNVRLIDGAELQHLHDFI